MKTLCSLTEKKQGKQDSSEHLSEVESPDSLLSGTMCNRRLPSTLPVLVKSHSDSDFTDNETCFYPQNIPKIEESIKGECSEGVNVVTENIITISKDEENTSSFSVENKTGINDSFNITFSSSDNSHLDDLKSRKYQESSNVDMSLQKNVMEKTDLCSTSLLTSPVHIENNSQKQSSEMEVEEPESLEKKQNSKALSHSTDSEEVKMNAKTRVIRTRSGRKTRFTFFAKTLLDNYEEESNLNESQVIHISDPQNVILEDKSTQCDVNVPVKKKRGRPRKPKEVALLSSVETISKRDKLSEKGNYTSKDYSAKTNVTVKKIQPPVRPISSIFSDEGYSGMCLGSRQATLSSEKLIHSKNCSVSDAIDTAMEMHRLDRIEKENTLFSILENCQKTETLLSEKVLKLFKSMEDVLNARIKT